MSTARAIFLVALLALVWHLGWATTIRVPVDWDPAYYLDVARNLADGRGAVSRSIWHLSGPDLSLPIPADLHWMPLPSRVLVPGVWLADGLGAAFTTALIAALWVPVAAVLARELAPEAPRRTLVLAAVLAGLGGGYVRFLSTPDSIALFGLVGGLGWLAAARGSVAGALMASVAAALCRGDGFLLAAGLSVAFCVDRRWRAGLAVLCAGPLTTLAWTGRNVAVAGGDWLDGRATVSAALHIHDVLLGRRLRPELLDRLQGAAAVALDAVQVALLVGLVWLPLLAGLAAGWHRRRAWVIGAGAYAVGMPVLTGFLAPGVAASGTAFRSGAALFPVACALAARAAVHLGEVGHRRRGYPVGLVPGLLVVGMLVGSLGVGVQTARLQTAPELDCAPLRAVGGPVLTGRPLELSARCELETVAFFRGESPGRIAERARRHGARAAWLPSTDRDPLVPTAAEAEGLLPGWSRRSEGVYVAPAEVDKDAHKDLGAP